MSRFREGKKRFAALCAVSDWKQALASEITDCPSARGALNPLLALLPRPELRLRAAYGLGLAVSLLAKEDKEAARVFMRRLMWNLNEESGNLGWGVPEAMGAILAESPALAGEYGRIFLSYGLETGREDNFLDHPPLRIGLYQGIGWLATENAAAAGPALPCLVKALGVENHPLRGMAAYALRQLAKTAPGSAFLPCAGSGRDVWGEAETALARALAAESAAQGPPDMLDVLDGEREQRVSVADMLAQALGVVRQRLAL